MLAFPAAVAGFIYTNSLTAGAIIGLSFIFGGLMFGPDLDTVSRQYSRWFAFRFLWFPYRSFFKHRSRFSHGLLFGALFRVIYFLGVITLVAFLAAFVWAVAAGGKEPDIVRFAEAWRSIGAFIRDNFGPDIMLLVFLGLWLGAASHTFTDMAGSFIKTGRVAKFL